MKMYTYLVCLIVLILPSLAFSAEFSVLDAKYSLSVVYQSDNNENDFEFIALNNGSDHQHRCGGTVYRVKSNTAAIADRKFSLATSALVADLKLQFRETGVCSSDGLGRMEVSWVQLRKN